MNGSVRHSVLTGLSVVETELHRKARLSLCFPQENIAEFEEKSSFWESKRQLDDGIKKGGSSSSDEFGKALVIFQTFDVSFDPDPQEDPKETTPSEIA